MAKKEKSSKKKPEEMNKKELDSEVDKIIAKNFEDFKSQDDMENFIQKAFDDKVKKFNKDFDLKEKELDKKIKTARQYDNKKIDRKVKEMDKKLKLRYKNLENR